MLWSISSNGTGETKTFLKSSLGHCFTSMWSAGCTLHHLPIRYKDPGTKKAIFFLLLPVSHSCFSTFILSFIFQTCSHSRKTILKKKLWQEKSKILTAKKKRKINNSKVSILPFCCLIENTSLTFKKGKFKVRQEFEETRWCLKWGIWMEGSFPWLQWSLGYSAVEAYRTIMLWSSHTM